MQLKMNFPGYLCVKIEGANCQKVLSMCTFRNISLCDVTCKDMNCYENAAEHASMTPKCIRKTNNKKRLNKSYTRIQRNQIANKDTLMEHPQSYVFKIPWKQYQELLALCEKTDSQIIILSHHGWISLQTRMLEHVSFLIGILLCLFLILFMQTRIWDIQVTGNIYYDSPVLIEYLKTQNVTPGINKGKISCIELADKIRQEFPKIKWTSVELDGCNLIVHLKENLHLGAEENTVNNTANKSDNEKTTSSDSDNIEPKNATSSVDTAESIDLVSDKDGIIQSIYVRSGIANVKEGDTCKKGDILVKGQIPIYNDSQEIVRYEYVEADADIMIQHDYHYFDEIERNISEKKLVKTTNSSFIKIFDYYFSFTPYIFNDNHTRENETNNNSNTTSSITNDKNTSKEHLKSISQLKFTSTLTLPCYFGTNTTYEYEIVPKVLTEKKAKELLEEEIFYFCDDLEKKGVQIYKNNVKMYISDAKGTAAGKVTVFEKTGEKQAYIPEAEESNPDTNNINAESIIE